MKDQLNYSRISAHYVIAYIPTNGKVEATVNSMKKLDCCGLEDTSVTTSSKELSFSIETLHCEKTAVKLFGKPIQDTQLIVEHFHNSGSALLQKPRCKPSLQRMRWKNTTTNTPTPYLISALDLVAIQNSNTKHWEIYGIATNIGSNGRYYVKTQSGRFFLVCNRRFLRQCVPLSVPGNNWQQTANSPETDKPNASSQPRSCQQWKLTKRLVHEMKSFSFSVEDRNLSTKLGGRN